ARGKFGGAIVFSNWKGIQTSRLLVTPSNPRTTGQMESRSKLATGGKATKVIDGESPFAVFMRSLAPNGQSYASYTQKEMLGPNFVNPEAALADYGNVSYSTEAGYYDSSAAAIGLEGVDLSSIGGDSIAAGGILWALYAAAYRLGFAEATTAPTSVTQQDVTDFVAELSAA